MIDRDVDVGLGTDLLVAFGAQRHPIRAVSGMHRKSNDRPARAIDGLLQGFSPAFEGWARRLPGVAFVRIALTGRKADGEHKSAPGRSAGDAVGRSR